LYMYLYNRTEKKRKLIFFFVSSPVMRNSKSRGKKNQAREKTHTHTKELSCLYR